ncbi:MAG: ribonuclease R [Bermanella sp.]
MSKQKTHNKQSGKTSWIDPHAEREAGNYENPVPSRELMLEYLENCDEPATHMQLVEVFDLSDEDQIEAIRRRLIAMCRDGQLIENRRNAFIPMSRIELIRGRVQGHKDGYGFLIREDGEKDFHLSAKQMRKVFDGDKVAVRVAGVDNRGKEEAVIVEVIQRNTHQLVGRFYTQGESAYVVPDNRRIPHEILINSADMASAEHGQFVVVDIIGQPDSRRLPVGAIKEVLGDHLAPGMEIDIALRSHDIPFEFANDAAAQAEGIENEVSEADKQTRLDLRQMEFVTIDGEDSKDFDDAVFCEFNEDTQGWTLYVAIADVSHYVPVNSPLDIEAINRGNSVYFPEHVVPMLPEKLSNGLCSLKPKVDRLCMVCEMDISASGKLEGYTFYEGVMHSHARLTYNLVGKMIDEKDNAETQQLRREHSHIVKQVDDLHALYKVLRVERTKRGAIDFDTTETRIIFNAERKIQDIVPVVRNDAHKLIEECMLCANVATAQFLQQHKVPSLYRVHDGPSEQKLENLRKYLTEQGITLNGGDQPSPKDYLHVMEQIADRPDAKLMQIMLLRSMSQAMYQPENNGHFGLAYKAYTHFTSPIRRYADLLVHRAIRSLIRGESQEPALLKTIHRAEGASVLSKAEIYPYDTAALLQFGEQTSLTERRADDATRDVMDFLKCEYMRTHVGDEFTGVVSAVTGFGLFVQLKDLYIEGLIHVTNLSNDFYSFDPIRLRLTGERSGKSFRMGDELTILVSRVDLDDRKIDFELAGSDATPAGGAPKKRSKKPARKGSAKAADGRGPARSRKPKRPVRKREVAADESTKPVTKKPASKKAIKDPFSGAKKAKKTIMDGLRNAAKKLKKSKKKKPKK